MSNFLIRETNEEDRSWVCDLLKQHWGSTIIVTAGHLHDAARLPGFAAFREGNPVGLLTYCIENDSCEIVSLNSLKESEGVGTALLEAVRKEAARCRCRRIRLVTTNDNTRALRFYQIRGFVISKIHINSMREARRLKAEIPEKGIDGIPIRDEIELELDLRSQV